LTYDIYSDIIATNETNIGINMEDIVNMDWKKEAKFIIKKELLKQDIDYVKLCELLKEIGVDENAGNIANKLSRGTFSFIFALQIFKAIDLENLRLKD